MPEGLAPGVHRFPVADPIHRYLVAGSGPVCVVNPGRCRADREYRRMPALEDCLTMVYLAAADGPELSVDAQVRLLRAVVSQLGDQPPLIFGDGSGCRAAMTFALHHPELVAGLILYRSAVDPVDLQALPAEVPLLIIDPPSGFLGCDVA